MRKVKVAAASLCLLSYGMLHGGIINSEVSVAKTDLSDAYIEMTAETVTTAASIETTSIVTTATTAKTAYATARTTAAAATRTTASSAPATTTAASTTTVTEANAAPETASIVQTEPEQFLAESSEQEISDLSDAAETAWSTQTETTASSEAESEVTADAPAALTVTDREYCMLCNVVGHEYGANWVPEADKALVVEVIMNRVNSPAFPNTIYDVLMQRNQFAGLEYLVNMDGMSGYVTDSVKAAVDLYLADPSQFNHGYLYFNGDGYRNYFRTGY